MNNEIIKNIEFKVSGITFENRQEIIENMVDQAIKKRIIKPYNGLKDKDILELDSRFYETYGSQINTIRIEPVEINNKDAIEIYIKDFEGKNEYLIGYVPKEQIKEVIGFLEIYQKHPEYKIQAYATITGGRFNEPYYDSYLNEVIIKGGKLNYGVLINIKLIK